MSEAAGAFRIIAGAAHDALDLAGSVAGHGRAAADAIGNVVGGAGSNSKPIAAGVAAAAGANGAATGAASNLDKYGKVSFGDKEKASQSEIARAAITRQAIPMTWTFAERNPFVGTMGCFSAIVDSIADSVACLPMQGSHRTDRALRWTARS